MMSYTAEIHALFDRNADELRSIIAASIEPSLMPEIVKWAEENYRLAADDAAAPGLIRLHNYQKEILRSWSEPNVRTVVLRGSSQIGKSVIGLIIAAYSLRFRSGPTRLATESDASALKFARERIAPMVRENLNDLQVKRKSGRGGQKELKFANSSSLTIVNAGTPSGLSSSPVRTFLGTEIRGWPLSSGKDGDPLALAKARGKTFGDYKLFVESSPGLAGACRLSEEYSKGDARLWHVCCPHCGHEAPMNYDAIPGHHFVYFKKPADAQMSCAECGSLWSAVERHTALYNGKFKPTKESDDNGETISFHFSELESAQYTLESIVRRVEESRKSTEKLQAAWNTILGQPFDAEENAGLELVNESLESSIERYNALQLLPAEALVITAGIDCQLDRVEIQTLGHGVGKRRWSLEYHIIHGDPNGETLWNAVKEWLLSKRYKHPSGGTLAIKAVAIDSGNNTQSVYNFSADALARGRAWYAIKGMPGSRPIAKKSANTSLRAGTTHKLVQVGVDAVKSLIFDAFSHDGEENRIFLPSHYDQAFHDSLTAERKIISTVKGKPVISFKKFKHGARNEALDTLVYGIAAFELITPAPDFAAIARSLDTSNKPKEIDYLAHVRAAAEGRGNAHNAYGVQTNDR